MQQIIPTIDRLLKHYRPLNRVIEALVTRIVPNKTATACCSTCGINRNVTCDGGNEFGKLFLCNVGGRCVVACGCCPC